MSHASTLVLLVSFLSPRPCPRRYRPRPRPTPPPTPGFGPSTPRNGSGARKSCCAAVPQAIASRASMLPRKRRGWPIGRERSPPSTRSLVRHEPGSVSRDDRREPLAITVKTRRRPARPGPSPEGWPGSGAGCGCRRTPDRRRGTSGCSCVAGMRVRALRARRRRHPTALATGRGASFARIAPASRR